MIKQKILLAKTASGMQSEINIALDMGWLVQSITVNSETNMWIAVMYREAT